MYKNSKFMLEVSIKFQQLIVYEITNTNEKKILHVYLISTAKNGAGQFKNSNQTPLGKHYIRAYIGDKQPLNMIFKARRPTGEIYSKILEKNSIEKDFILTRILWLCGKEIGKNRRGNVDTMQRYIYFHGSPDSNGIFGIPMSHGCIRMRNKDILHLFNLLNFQKNVEVNIIN